MRRHDVDAELQARTIAELSARCEGPNQFENFDRAFRHSLTVPKDAVIMEEARLKRLRARRRAKTPTIIEQRKREFAAEPGTVLQWRQVGTGNLTSSRLKVFGVPVVKYNSA